MFEIFRSHCEALFIFFMFLQAELFTIPMKPRYMWGTLFIGVQVVILISQTGGFSNENSKWLWLYFNQTKYKKTFFLILKSSGFLNENFCNIYCIIQQIRKKVLSFHCNCVDVEATRVGFLANWWLIQWKQYMAPMMLVVFDEYIIYI